MFTKRKSSRFSPRPVIAAICSAAALSCGAVAAHAGVPGVDLYMGAGLGQSNADLSTGDIPGAIDFKKEDLGWKLYAGARFLSFFGAEVDYINFGKPDGDNTSLKYKGLAGFGMYYLPIPLPLLDVYVKAGVARVDSDLKVDANSFNTDDTKFAFGGGVKLNLSSFSIRAEYEKFKVDGAKPALLSVGFSKSFL